MDHLTIDYVLHFAEIIESCLIWVGSWWYMQCFPSYSGGNVLLVAVYELNYLPFELVDSWIMNFRLDMYQVLKIFGHEFRDNLHHTIMENWG